MEALGRLPGEKGAGVRGSYQVCIRWVTPLHATSPLPVDLCNEAFLHAQKISTQ